MENWRIIQILCERLLQYFRNISYKFWRNFALIFHKILLNEKWCGHKNISEIFLWNISERFTVILRKIIPQHFWNISCQVFRLFKLFVKVCCNIWETFLTSCHETAEIFYERSLNEKWCGHQNISARFTVIFRKIIPQDFWNISWQVRRFFKLFVKVFCNISETFLTSFQETFHKYFMKYCWTKNDADIKTFLQSFCEIFLQVCKPFMKPCRNISAIFRAI